MLGPRRCTCASFGSAAVHVGDDQGRTQALNEDGHPTVVLEGERGVAVQCVLEADLVGCGAGIAVGDARGRACYFHRGQLLCEHTLPLAILAMAAHRPTADASEAVAAADASGVVLLFGAHAPLWRVRLGDVLQLRGSMPSANSLVSVVTDDGGAAAPDPTLVAAVGGRDLALLDARGAARVWRAAGEVSALCAAPARNVSAERASASVPALVVAADGELLAVKQPGTGGEARCDRLCVLGTRATAIAALEHAGEATYACCGHFEGVLIVTRHGPARHVVVPASRAGADGWVIAVRLGGFVPSTTCVRLDFVRADGRMGQAEVRLVGPDIME